MSCLRGEREDGLCVGFIKGRQQIGAQPMKSKKKQLGGKPRGSKNNSGPAELGGTPEKKGPPTSKKKWKKTC